MGFFGLEVYVCFVMFFILGKIEIVFVVWEFLCGMLGMEDGFVILKLYCLIVNVLDWGKIVIVGWNFDVVWFDDYRDCVIYDEVGLFFN